MQLRKIHQGEIVPVCIVCGTCMERTKQWLFRCPACSLQRSSLAPGVGTGFDEAIEGLRRTNFELILDRLERRRPLSGLRLLDVGCARGWFLEVASRRKMVGQGIEPDQANSQIARANGLSVETGHFPADLKDRGPYDVIVFNDVLEHLSAPALAVQETERLLKMDGVAVINLPSSDGTLFRIATVLTAMGAAAPLKRLWQMGLESPHLWYFNSQNLATFVTRHTRLMQTDTFMLPSVTRAGLRERIRVTHTGPKGTILYAGAWLLSYVLRLLPADIHVAVFAKQEGRK